MPRWPEWCRKVGETATHPAALNVGRKLLGYLSTRRETPGVQTLVKRVTLDDGTTVEARFIGDQPQVIVYAPDGHETCELYVESGLLDLGPNIAADAGERFDRGPPEFDDRPATLYFGDGVDCRQGEPGLNGKVRVTPAAKRLVSECLPKQGRSVESRLRDPAKKKAQAMLPASCWSGLMQRYVQAVYGGTALKYSGTPEALTVEGVTIRLDESWGLLELSGKLRFVQIGDGGNATFYEVKPKSPCFAAVLALWRTLRDGDDAAVADKVLTIGLSGCKIGDSISVADGLPTGNRHFKKRAAWAFSRDGRKAVAVLESDGVASVYEATFTINSTGALSVSASARESADAFNGSAWPLIVGDASPWKGGGAAKSGIEGEDELAEGDSFDFPVYAYYDRSDVKVVRFSILAAGRVVDDLSYCMRAGDQYGYRLDGFSNYVTGATIRVSPDGGADKSNACGATIKGVIEVARGYYADGWSSVSVCKALIPMGDDNLLVPVAKKMDVMGVDSDLIEGSVTVTSESLVADYLATYCANTGIGFGVGGVCFPYNMTGEPCTTIADVMVSDPDPPPCFSSTLDSVVFTATNEYAPYTLKGAVFLGDIGAGSVPVLSLAFGATDVFVCTDYTFVGGSGGHATVNTWMNSSFNGTDFRGSSGVSVEQRTCTASGAGSFTVTRTWSIPPPAPAGDFILHLGQQGVGQNMAISRNGSGVLQYTKTPLDTGWTIHVMPTGARGVESATILVAGSATTQFDTQRGCATVSPDSPADATPFAPGDADLDACAVYEMVGLRDLIDDHIETEFPDGPKAWSLQDGTNHDWLMDGFAYEGARSLLSAVIEPMPMLDRGNSVNMDRQTISGGYPKVSTPSFVGWA